MLCKADYAQITLYKINQIDKFKDKKTIDANVIYDLKLILITMYTKCRIVGERSYCVIYNDSKNYEYIRRQTR